MISVLRWGYTDMEIEEEGKHISTKRQSSPSYQPEGRSQVLMVQSMAAENSQRPSGLKAWATHTDKPVRNQKAHFQI